MEFPKQLKDQVYTLLQEPTLDKFREFLHAQTGEHNAIDFKRQWIEDAALAKEILALANSQIILARLSQRKAARNGRLKLYPYSTTEGGSLG